MVSRCTPFLVDPSREGTIPQVTEFSVLFDRHLDGFPLVPHEGMLCTTARPISYVARSNFLKQIVRLVDSVTDVFALLTWELNGGQVWVFGGN